MSLFEAFTALVILGLTAAGYLEVFQSGAQSATRADEWQRVVAEAEATMEATTLAVDASTVLPSTPTDAYARRVEVRPWDTDVSEIVVTVTSPGGTEFTLRRLRRSAPR